MTGGAAAGTRSTWSHETLVLASSGTGRRYQVWIEAPGRYDPADDRRYPVVVCLDGPWTFGVVRDAFRLLPLSRELPEAIVVGVAHDQPDLREVLQQRAADFTPTPADAPPATGVRLAASELGGAGAFARFLADEVLPAVAARYRTSGDATLVGHSFSGLFGLSRLLLDPTWFDRWVLASPSVWWDDRVVFALEAAQAATGADLPTRVFLSCADEDPAFGGHRRFYDQLVARRRPGLRATWHHFEGETHQSVIPAALTRGLRQVFAPG